MEVDRRRHAESVRPSVLPNDRQNILLHKTRQRTPLRKINSVTFVNVFMYTRVYIFYHIGTRTGIYKRYYCSFRVLEFVYRAIFFLLHSLYEFQDILQWTLC